MAVPEEELEAYRLGIYNAYSLATEAHPMLGLAELERGCDRARGLSRDGAPWVSELVALWEEAVRHYLSVFPLSG